MQQPGFMAQGQAELSHEVEVDADVMSKLAHIWHSNPQVDYARHADGFQLDALHGFATLSHCQIYPERCRSSVLVQHDSDASDPQLSCYSSWFKLLKEEWYSSDITHYFSGDGMQDYSLESDDNKTRYHGTTLKAVVSMLSTGGFIPGPNGHGHRGKYLQGLFCATEVGEAFLRVDPWREATRDGHLDLLGCPVVVELKVASFKLRRYHQHRRDLRVVEGMPGVLMQGISLAKVHINRRYFWNFCLTRNRRVSRDEVCGQHSAGCMTCGHYISIDRQNMVCKGWTDLEIGYKSKPGNVYCPHCAGMYCKSSLYIGRAPA